MNKDAWKFKTRCNECTEEFILKYEDIKEVTIDNIKVKYFKCKLCDEIYITECVDDFIVKERLLYQRMNSPRKKKDCMNRMIDHSDKLKLKIINKL